MVFLRNWGCIFPKHYAYLLLNLFTTRESGVSSSPLGQNGRYVADDIFKCIFVNENVSLFNLHWNWSGRVELTINQHWFRQWLVACSAPSHYLNQCWPSWLTHICGTRGRWVNSSKSIDAYMGEETMTSLDQLMACPMCRQPLSESIVAYYYVNPSEQISIKMQIFSYKKMTLTNLIGDWGIYINRHSFPKKYMVCYDFWTTNKR